MAVQDDLDDPKTTAVRQSLLLRPGYLRALYQHWYQRIVERLPEERGEVLELGSGGGFLTEAIPGLRTSDVMPVPGVELAIDARQLPFGDGTLRAIVGTNVLHHVPMIRQFLCEAERTLVGGGRLIFIEPWPTPFSKWVYRWLHHEPFDMRRDWSIPEGGPLTAANGALPWIVFQRDRRIFTAEFPNLLIRERRAFMPFSYLLSGGIGRTWRLPSWLFRAARLLEMPFDRLGLFALVIIERAPRT